MKCVLGHAVCFSLPLTFYGTRLLEPSPPLSFIMRALTFDLSHSPSRPRSYFHALADPHALALDAYTRTRSLSCNSRKGNQEDRGARDQGEGLWKLVLALRYSARESGARNYLHQFKSHAVTVPFCFVWLCIPQMMRPTSAGAQIYHRFDSFTPRALMLR